MGFTPEIYLGQYSSPNLPTMCSRENDKNRGTEQTMTGSAKKANP